MALFRRFFYRKPPDGLLEISERVFVFDCCFTTDVPDENDYKSYMAKIVENLREYSPDASFMVFNFREGDSDPSPLSLLLSLYDMTVMDYPRRYETCPVLPMETIHHFLRSSESWLSLGPNNMILAHCERGGWPALVFMLSSLLIYRKNYTGEQKTLDMIYKQAPRELLKVFSPLDPVPSQLRYLQYVSRRNLGSEWPLKDRALTLDCVILRFIPNMDGEGGCRPIFRIYGQDPLMADDRTAKMLYSPTKRSRSVRYYKQADCELVKIDIRCHVQGDVVLECINLDNDLEREVMAFRVMFNTAFIRSNILIVNRDEIDTLWGAKNQFPVDFRTEVLFSEMDVTAPLLPIDLPEIEVKGLPIEAFAKVQEIFSNVEWLGPKTDDALNILQEINIHHEKSDSITENITLLRELCFDEIKKKPTTEGLQKIDSLLQKLDQIPTQSAKEETISVKSENSFENFQQEASKLDKQSIGTKIITRRRSRSSLSAPASYCNSLQGSPVSLSRYHSAPSLLGITTLLHDEREFERKVIDHHVQVSPSQPRISKQPSSSPRNASPKSPPHVQVSSPSTVSTPPPPPLGSTMSPGTAQPPPTTPPLPPRGPTSSPSSALVPSPPPPQPSELASTASTVGPTSSPRTSSPSSSLPTPSPQPSSGSTPSLDTAPLALPMQPPPPPAPPEPSPSFANASSAITPPSPSPKAASSPSIVSPLQTPPGLASIPIIASSSPPPSPPPLIATPPHNVVPSAPPPLRPTPIPSVASSPAPPQPPPPPPPVSPSSSAPPPPPSPVPSPSKAPPPPLPPVPSSPSSPPPPPKSASSTTSSAPKPPPPAPFGNGLPKMGGGPPIPGPPSIKKGRLPSRVSSRGLDQPKTPLKPYHWLKLTRAMNGSLWAEAQISDEASKAPEIDIFELESLFAVAVPNSNGGIGGKSNSRASGPKSEKVNLVDLRRAYNCEIMLTKVKVPLPELMSSILTLDDSALDIDQVENLVKFCPTKEEIEVLKNYKDDKEKLGKCEQFFLEMMKVPRVESKLNVFAFKLHFSSQVSDLRKNLNTVNSVATEIRNSVKLKRIMQTILSLGNALNHGTARGSAVGFRLDSLLKLTDTRARNNKMTLMHYLCKVLSEKLPELLDFPNDLISLEASTKIQLKYLAEEMQAISKGLEKVIQELTVSENDGAVSDCFCKILKEFLSFAEGEVRSLASLYSGVGRNADALALYFGEDPARTPFEQVVSTLLNFVRMFARAREENNKQIEMDTKKAQKETENDKAIVSVVKREAEFAKIDSPRGTPKSRKREP